MKTNPPLWLRVGIILSLLFTLTPLAPGSAVFAQTPTTDIAAGLSFNPENTTQLGQSRLTITLTNNNTSYALTSAAFTLILADGDADLDVYDTPNVVNNCGGTVDADAGDTSIVLAGGTVPASGSCTILVNIGANSSGTHTLDFVSGEVTGYLNGTHYSNEDASNDAILNVATFDFNAEINKTFVPDSIVPGNISRLSVNIYNPNSFELHDAAWTDNLVAVQPGLEIADPANFTTDDCGTPGVTAAPGTTILVLENATVPAKVGSENGTCTLEVDVTSTTPGNLINRIEGGVLEATDESGTITVSNTDPANATLNVDTILPPSVDKSYSPNTIWVGQSSQMTINITNEDSGANHTIDEVSLTDTFPLNIVVASPVTYSLSGCGSSASLNSPAANDDYISLTDGEILPGATCRIRINVTSSVQGEYTNTIDTGDVSTRQGVTNGSDAEADLNVQAVGIEKEFSPDSIMAGETSTLTITLQNPTGDDYTGVALDDQLPGTVLYYSSTTSSQCGGTVTIESSNPGVRENDILRITGVTVPAGTIASPGTCTITADVTTPIDAGSSNPENVIPENSLTATTPSSLTNVLPASDSIEIQALSIGVDKSFSPSSIEEGRTSTLTIELSNSTSSIVHVTNFTDTLPGGLVIAGTPNAGTDCSNGQVNLTYGPPDSITFTGSTPAGAEIPAGSVDDPGTCSFWVDVEAASHEADCTNVIPEDSIDTVENITNLDEETETLDVYEEGLGMTGSMAFNPNHILAGGVSRLRITLGAPEDEPITGLDLVNTLPPGITITHVTSPYTSCSGSLTAADGTNTISLSGGSIAQGGSCYIDVYVTGPIPDAYTNLLDVNDLSQFDNDQDQRPDHDLSATLYITNLSISKAFYADTVAPGGNSTLTITLENTNTSALYDVDLTDNLTTMGGSTITVASPANASTTCIGGTVTATPTSQTIRLNDAIVPAQVGSVPGICTVSVDVHASSSTSPLPTTRTNTLYRSNVTAHVGSPSGTLVNPVANASDQLTITGLTLAVVKRFDPLTVFGGSSSTMSVTLINPNNTDLTGITFTDTMPSGMFVATPANFDTGTCNGAITGTPGSNTFTFSGGSIEGNRRCTLTLSVTMNVHGNRTNTIGAGDVTSYNGAENPQAASASLTNLPGASLSKFFTPAEIILGETSSLTIRITNTGNIPLTNVGLIDNLPGNLSVASSPAATNGCNGNLDAEPGDTVITLDGGSIAAGPDTTCDIVVPIEGSSVGEYTNTIPENSLQTDEGATNIEPASDTLTINATPNLTFSKNLNTALSSPAPFETGDTLVYTLVATNLGDVPLTNVTITDPDLVSFSCVPVQGSTLDPDESMSCSASHILTSTEAGSGSFTNTAAADSTETEPVTDSVTVPTNTSYVITLNKVITTDAPYELGDTLEYTITLTNDGVDTVTSVTIVDSDLVVSSCSPVQGSSLDAGDPMTCAATHVVTQADVDAGTFTDTATGSSNEAGPVTDSVTVTIEDNARLGIYKQVVSSGPYSVGDNITYDIAAINNGDLTLTGVTITDPGTGVVMGTCTPDQEPSGVTLAPGGILHCPATHTVTSGDMTNGGFENTAWADSDQTEPVSDTAEVVLVEADITLVKTGTVITGADGRADVDDIVSYTFTITNSGAVTLTDIRLYDIVGGVDITGGPIASLAPGASDNTTFTGTYTITQADIDAGSFDNTAYVTGTPPVGSMVNDNDEETVTLTAVPLLGMAKDLASGPTEFSPGVWDFSFEYLIRNYGNVTITSVQATDDLDAVFPTGTMTVMSITSSDFAVNSAFDGSTDTDMLMGTDSLVSGEEGTITLELRYIPEDGGPFNNTATVTGETPTGGDVSDVSQDGTNPDSDSDGNPTNNNEPTPVDFGDNLFDPPYGIKYYDETNLPLLQWTMIWINDTNIVNVNASVSDPIPERTTYYAVGAHSGTGFPSGAPAESTDVGVSCTTDAGSTTVTDWCYYEGPTTQYPLGRIVWEGELGPDLGVRDPEVAVNDLTIAFIVVLDEGTHTARNEGTIGADRDGSGDIAGPNEIVVYTVNAEWSNLLPDTGFAPGVETDPATLRPAEYNEMNGMKLEIPALNVNAQIVGVPLEKGEWNLDWLGNNVGYLEGTSFPTWSGNTALTAHNTDVNGEPGLFAELETLRWGQQVIINAYGSRYVYEVRSVDRFVRPEEADAITHEDLSWLTLITCRGYDDTTDSYRWRVVVRAVLVDVQDIGGYNLPR
ncbi:MAG: sortase [Anaerolineales bacterium]|nr:sortase [Anaerolineales bacterium]